MPPPSNIRKSSAVTTATVSQGNDLTSAPRRTTSGRAVRANTTRPTNYYARPLGSFSANRGEDDIQDASPPGFFPALQFFSDAITALPKEVMRQFTLMKEVEAKIHGPAEQLGEMVDDLMLYPVPPRKTIQNATIVDGQSLLSFTANNSVIGSANVSLVNGNAPNAISLSARNSVAGSVNGEDMAMVGAEEDLEKRRKFQEMRFLTHSLLPSLDEKNVVLAEANRVLAQQLSRLDSVLPHVDGEISEEARLGSMTHWAYGDNRQRKQVGAPFANRRDVAATHSLAAAANAIHESDIAQARKDAVRETAREKYKAKSREQLDSDFEERPKKTHAKIAKSKAAAQGLGISSNGEPIKRRKVDKGLAVPGLERSLSGAPKAVKGVKEIARSTPMGEPRKKVSKMKPLPIPAKRKGVTSNQGSPAMASSPLNSSFNVVDAEPPAPRPQIARARQGSTATNLRHERLADEDTNRPTSAPHKGGGERASMKRKATEDGHDVHEPMKKKGEMENAFMQEDGRMLDNAQISRSTSNSGKAGQGSKTGTPKNESFPDVPSMVRSRSTRTMRSGQDESSTEPQTGGGRHKRNQSNSHLVKQLAPFNRSPNIDQPNDDMEEDLESFDGRLVERQHEAEETSRSPPKRLPSSRRNTGNLLAPSPPPASDPAEEDAMMIDVEPEPESMEQEEIPDLEPDMQPIESEVDIDDEEESEPGDPDDPNEPKYCYCNRGSYGEMIACDNEQCPREWFHLGCTGLREPPDEIEKWYCEECKPLFVMKSRGKGRGGNRKLKAGD